MRRPHPVAERFTAWDMRDTAAPIALCDVATEAEAIRIALAQVDVGDALALRDHTGLHWRSDRRRRSDRVNIAAVTLTGRDPLAPPPRGPAVYFAGIEGGPVKVGWTGRAVWTRVADVAVGAMAPLILLGCLAAPQTAETEMHRAMRSGRIRGEWFTRDAALAAFRDYSVHHRSAPILPWPSLLGAR